jgi:hypothetical protein
MGEQPPPGSEDGGYEQVSIPNLGEDLVFKVLMCVEAWTQTVVTRVN